MALFAIPLSISSSSSNTSVADAAQTPVTLSENVVRAVRSISAIPGALTTTTTSPSTTTTTKAKPKVAAKPTVKKIVKKKAVTRRVAPTTTTTKPRPSPSHSLSGQASWYSARAGTCAMNEPPMGARVTVTSISTGKSISCVVTSRGPYVRGRIIDLDKSGFSSLASLGTGIISVRVTW